MNTYGVLDSNECHTDVSATLNGAKQYATKHGYDKVSIRYANGYFVRVAAEKVNGKWVNYSH